MQKNSLTLNISNGQPIPSIPTKAILGHMGVQIETTRTSPTTIKWVMKGPLSFLTEVQEMAESAGIPCELDQVIQFPEESPLFNDLFDRIEGAVQKNDSVYSAVLLYNIKREYVTPILLSNRECTLLATHLPYSLITIYTVFGGLG